MIHPSAARLLSPLGGMVTSFQFSARLHGHAQHEKLTNNKRGRKGYVYTVVPPRLDATLHPENT
jgi:hypothetical protein